MREIVQHLAEWLKSVVQVRRKRMKHGKFEFTIGGGSTTKDFTIPKEAKILDEQGQEIKEGLKAKFFATPGGVVTIQFVRKDDREIVTQVRIGSNPAAKKLEKKG